MSRVALFVDLPNFYSRLLKSGIETPKILKDYFLYWLDFDLLARSLTEEFSGVWVFYSGERIGPSGERIEGRYLNDYIRRINALEGVTAHNVNIPGDQREPVSYKCESCGKEGVSEAVSEKGVDASLTVHLFDTMDSWDSAFLLSGDADFVPAVASLRRRGKIVVGVGFSDASTALVRECYHYINIDDVFLRQDLMVYSILKNDGLAHKWLTSEVQLQPSVLASQVKLKMYWHPEGSWGPKAFTPSAIPAYCIVLDSEGPIDVANRIQLMEEPQIKYGEQMKVTTKGDNTRQYRFSMINPLNFESFNRRLLSFASSISELKFNRETNNGGLCQVTYDIDVLNKDKPLISESKEV